MRTESSGPAELVKKELNKSSQMAKAAPKASAACRQFQSASRSRIREGFSIVLQTVMTPAVPMAATVMTNVSFVVDISAMPVPATTAAVEGQTVSYGIRPGDLELASAGTAARVVVVEPTGAETELLVDVGGTTLTVVLHGRTQAKPDDTVYLSVDPNKAHVFDATPGGTSARLG